MSARFANFFFESVSSLDDWPTVLLHGRNTDENVVMHHLFKQFAKGCQSLRSIDVAATTATNRTTTDLDSSSSSIKQLRAPVKLMRLTPNGSTYPMTGFYIDAKLDSYNANTSMIDMLTEQLTNTVSHFSILHPGTRHVVVVCGLLCPRVFKLVERMADQYVHTSVFVLVVKSTHRVPSSLISRAALINITNSILSTNQTTVYNTQFNNLNSPACITPQNRKQNHKNSKKLYPYPNSNLNSNPNPQIVLEALEWLQNSNIRHLQKHKINFDQTLQLQLYTKINNSDKVRDPTAFLRAMCLQESATPEDVFKISNIQSKYVASKGNWARTSCILVSM